MNASALSEVFEKALHDLTAVSLDNKFVLVLLGGIGFLVLLVFFRKGIAGRSFLKNSAGIQHSLRILDTCSVDYQRKLVLFSCPFGQGILLLSPKGDSLKMIHERPGEEQEESLRASRF